MKGIRKRSTLHITQSCFDNVAELSNKKNIPRQQMLEEICNEIIAGEYDDLLKKDTTRSAAIYQDTLKETKDYLKSKWFGTVTEAIEIVAKIKNI